jgi:Asp-tRNA(Asn)/Glu-tRNA(Gln) amidotransferase A subunit family amidase
MPFGIQIIAKQNRDAFLLDAAHSIEKAFLGIDELSRPFPNLEKLAAMNALTLT